jgi:predicted alpha/beta-hydrolase family hydrolase
VTDTSWTVDVADDTISAAVDVPTTAERRVVFVCSHGAGGNMDDRALRATAKALCERGMTVIRHNFLYTEKKSGRPDPMPKLQDCITAVVERARRELRPDLVLIGGRSMGGRAASMLASTGFDADGLLLLAYPLHPAGQPTKLRDAHLPNIAMPTICFNGTRDALCTPDLMKAVLQRVGDNWTMHWVEGADHSFHVLKSSGRTDAQVMGEVGDAASAWAARLPQRS